MIRSNIFELKEGTSAFDITPPSQRRSTIFLTKFEVARIVAERAKQIVDGVAQKMFSHGVTGRDSAETAEHCTDCYSLAVDPVVMAKYDLIQGRIPMFVQRIWPNGDIENIPINELQVDPLLLDLNY